MDMVEHSKPTRIMAYCCAAVLLPAYTLGPIFLIYQVSFKFASFNWVTNLFLLAVFWVLSFWGCRSFYLMIRFLSTIKASLSYDENAVTLHRNGKISVYRWDQLKNSRPYKDCQILCLIDEKNNYLCSIWEYAKNYQQFRKTAHEAIGI